MAGTVETAIDGGSATLGAGRGNQGARLVQHEKAWREGLRGNAVDAYARGLGTTASDERGRDTVYRCFDGAGLGWIAPVGRLDQASEGLLLFTNDPAWAAAITDPARGPDKTYHVQVDGCPPEPLLAAMVRGLHCDGERLAVASVRVLRVGSRKAWLEVVLHEGRNRQIRRLMAACGLEVLRLVRVAIGPVVLGDLAKGAWRALDEAELAALTPPSTPVAA